jgi:hypothetical protein
MLLFLYLVVTLVSVVALWFKVGKLEDQLGSAMRELEQSKLEIGTLKQPRGNSVS